MTQDRRKQERSATRESVRFELAGVLHFGTMRNLSRHGCMIESPALEAAIGQRCEIRLLPGYVVSGRIAWQLGDGIGISFHLPIPSALVREFSLDDWAMRSAARQVGHQAGR